MQLTEISFNELSKQVAQFPYLNKGNRPSFVIVSNQTYWALMEEVYLSGLFPPPVTDRIKMRVRGVPVISSNELELDQVEIVTSGEDI